MFGVSGAGIGAPTGGVVAPTVPAGFGSCAVGRKAFGIFCGAVASKLPSIEAGAGAATGGGIGAATGEGIGVGGAIAIAVGIPKGAGAGAATGEGIGAATGEGIGAATGKGGGVYTGLVTPVTLSYGLKSPLTALLPSLYPVNAGAATGKGGVAPITALCKSVGCVGAVASKLPNIVAGVATGEGIGATGCGKPCAGMLGIPANPGMFKPAKLACICAKSMV